MHDEPFRITLVKKKKELQSRYHFLSASFCWSVANMPIEYIEICNFIVIK